LTRVIFWIPSLSRNSDVAYPFSDWGRIVSRDVVVIIGIGGIGSACARRLGAGTRLVIADVSADRIADVANVLGRDGFDVIAQSVDVTNRASVNALVETVASAGRLRIVVHTAAVSPGIADAVHLLRVDLLGTAHILDGFLPHTGEGTVGVCIASIGGYAAGLSREVEEALSSCPPEHMLDAIGQPLDTMTPLTAYNIAKRGVQLLVERDSFTWGARGARLVSISPGVVSTEMGRRETADPSIAARMAMRPIARLATTEDIAAAAAWLASAEASYVTGCDLRIDGGLLPALKTNASLE
jgi:NAD(P)-dependent dehydrogenase (short-subunit alcohol dehydrogenase family)